MAFNISGWGQVTKTANTSYVVPASGVGALPTDSTITVFTYYTTDALADCLTTGYFADVVRSLKLRDQIIIQAADDQVMTVYVLQINYGVNSPDSRLVFLRQLSGELLYKETGINAAQILALAPGAGITLVPAPGAGRYIVYHGAVITATGGVAYGNVAGNPFAICHATSLPTEYGTIDAVGILGSVNDGFLQVGPGRAASATAALVSEAPATAANVVNKALILTKAAGAGLYTLGTKLFSIRTYYTIY